jgi:integrase
LVLGYCGLRLGEAVALRRESVKGGKLVVMESATRVTGQGMVLTGTKTGKTREVGVPGPVWDRLVVDLPAEPGALVFPGRKGTFLTNHEYRYTFDKAVAVMRAGAAEKRAREIAETGKAVTPEFPPITPHGLRHTCASLYISRGHNPKVIQRLLGHATAAMTLDLYGHLYDADLTRAADDLGAVFEAAAVSLRSDGAVDIDKAS